MSRIILTTRLDQEIISVIDEKGNSTRYHTSWSKALMTVDEKLKEIEDRGEDCLGTKLPLWAQ